MLEQSHRLSPHVQAGDLKDLQQRVRQQRNQHAQRSRSAATYWNNVRTALGSQTATLRNLPSRYLLHLAVAMVLPLALLLSQLPPGQITSSNTRSVLPGGQDFVAPVAPLSLDAEHHVGDAPLDDADIPVPLSLVSLNEALAPNIVQSSVAAEKVFLRSGPGTEYDAVGRLRAGAELQVIGRYGDWFQVRERMGAPVYWISGELLDIPEAAIYTLFEIPEQDLPAPPPPKVGTVLETGLALRDGPGTNYVAMVKLESGTQLELIERYQDWYHVVVNDVEGWVKGEFLGIEPLIIERLLVADTIPDPNPALVGRVTDDKVNLRKGPDSRYAKVGSVNAGLVVDLIGKYKDWYRIRLADGTKAWVFSDFVNTSSHVLRRVPVSRDFPALPVATRGVRGPSAGLWDIPASGDVASFAVQFVGARYRWGGSSPASGFDCSGLMRYVYSKYGVNLPRSAASQFNTAYGASVGPMENLQPGDLMFFVNTGGRRGITHVAMYIGGGRMVHAMTPRYGVQVSSIYNGYWTSRYYGGIRVQR